MKDISKKEFVEKLEQAINTYLKKKKYLQNGKGIKYYCASPTANRTCLKFSSKHQENILTTFLDCTTNARPCLSGYIDLTLKRDGCVRFSKTNYYFHICTSDYNILSTNPFEIIIKNITVLLKQGSRWY